MPTPKKRQEELDLIVALTKAMCNPNVEPLFPNAIPINHWHRPEADARWLAQIPVHPRTVAVYEYFTNMLEGVVTLDGELGTATSGHWDPSPTAWASFQGLDPHVEMVTPDKSDPLEGYEAHGGPKYLRPVDRDERFQIWVRQIKGRQMTWKYV